MIEIEPLRIPPTHLSSKNGPAAENDRLLQRAREFEAVFVAQMLSYGGLSQAISSNSGFGGEAFSTMLVQEYANKLVEKGGFGVAEHIYNQLLDKEARSETDTAV